MDSNQSDEGENPTIREYDKNFEGYYHKRKRHDDFCLVIFAVATILEIIILAVIIRHNGELFTQRAMNDSWDNECGVSKGFEKRPNLFKYKNYRNQSLKTCVRKCPQKNWHWLELSAKEKLENAVDMEDRAKYLLCGPQFDVNKTKDLSIEMILRSDTFNCPVYYFATVSLTHECFERHILDESYNRNLHLIDLNCDKRYPVYSNDSSLVFKSFIDVYQKVKLDLRRTAIIYLILGFFGSLLAGGWSFLMRTFSVAIIYFIQVFCNLLIAFIAVYSFYKGYNASKYDENDMPKEDLMYWRVFWTTTALVSTLLFLIVFFCLFFLKASIKVASAVIESASKALGDMAQCFFFPIITLALKIAVIFNFFYITTSVFSWTYELNSKDDTQNIEVPWFFYIVHAYNLFYTWWCYVTLSAFHLTVISGCICNWYFTSHNQVVSSFVLINSIKRVVKYHTGSIFLGSILKSFTTVPRFMLRQVDEYTYRSDSKICNVVLYPCMKINDILIKYLNSYAFISIAMHGSGYFASGKEAFKLKQSTKNKIIMIDDITNLILLIGELSLALLTSIIGYFVVTNKNLLPEVNQEKDELNYFWIPVLITGIITYAICNEFFSIFDYSIMALNYSAMREVSIKHVNKNYKFMMNDTLENAIIKKKAAKKKKQI